MSKEQIEACENCLHYSACLINSEYVPTPCRAYEDKAGYRKQSEWEWISVEERSPEETCECLIVDTLGVIYLASYSSRYRAFNATDEDDGDTWRLNNITHWMPIPEPPMMKGGAE